MIHAIKIRNYQSIRDELVLDFTVGRQAPVDTRYVKSGLPDTRIALIQAFIGANGSGKTTALRALVFVRWLLVYSFTSTGREIPLKQFAGYGKSVEPTDIEVIFEVKKEIHVYRVRLTTERVLSEELLIRDRSGKNLTSKRIFLRKWNSQANKYVINDVDFGISEPFWQSASLGNSSIIAVANRFGAKQAVNITHSWKKILANIEVEDHYRLSYETSPWYALDYYKSHPKMRNLAENDIKKYDIGISGFGKDGSFTHKYGESSFKLDIEQESSGTKQLLVMKRMIEEVLIHGGTVIIDEPDSFLHPVMLRSLIERFSDDKINKGSGQIIFSTHDIYVLDFLEKYEVYLTNKNRNNGVTNFRRLDTIPGVRNSDNFVKKYFEGEYGGLPEFEF